MTLPNVNRHVEGTYVCTANNGVGEPSSAEIKLQVEYRPEINPEQVIIEIYLLKVSMHYITKP